MDHYSRPLPLVVPPLAQAALLLWVTRSQIVESENPLDVNLLQFPADRATALALGLDGPTIADIVEFRSTKISAPALCPLVLDDCLADEFVNSEDGDDDEHAARSRNTSSTLTGSERYDTDWYRLVSCLDPWRRPPALRGIVYRLGSIAGSWAGRFVVSISFHDGMIRVD